VNSALYDGWVRHRRSAPAHEFTYRLGLAYLDLEEIDEVCSRSTLWSSTQPAPAWMRRADYLGDAERPLRESVLDQVEHELGRRPVGPIRLLTNVRYFGYVFNPVSFYYCFDQSGTTLDAIIAEITNTPWGERHAYVLDATTATATRWRFVFDKEFHVSPFMPMALKYDWRFSLPGTRLLVHMALSDSGSEIFDATMVLRRRQITGKSLRWLLLRHPLMTARTTLAIHWQALVLKLKGAPFHSHPKHAPGFQGGS